MWAARHCGIFISDLAMMNTDVLGLEIVNPKRVQRHYLGRQAWYPFYASFSLRFAEALLSSTRLSRGSLILDPWNGTGTSTLAAASLGHLTRGFDLNPVMVVAARGKLLTGDDLIAVGDALRLLPTTRSSPSITCEADALSTWFSPESVREIRTIEKSFHRALGTHERNGNGNFLTRMPKPASFFYIVLFRIVRHFLAPFLSSNPTWIRRPKTGEERIRFAKGEGVDMFASLCKRLLSEGAVARTPTRFANSKVDLASAESLPLKEQSIDYILTSPPYCTRLDYAVATMPELAVLGYGGDRFTQLRRTLTGTLTVNELTPDVSAAWGPTCTRFLTKLRRHPSKASQTYYLKTHLQYFASIERSLNEMHRVMRNGAQCVLVVQDSYYKDVRNDLPKIFTEMAELKGLRLTRRQDFKLSRMMARINPRARKYRQRPTAVESVLCFSKP